MMPVLTKPADEISADDIKALVNSHVPEGERIEFKRELPAKGTRDPWLADKKIGDYAKNQILKEVVAFANAHGGVLVLGIEEDDASKPAVASSICPVPKCEDLAYRFSSVFRDRVEPQLPLLEIFAVVTKGLEDGVVVFRAPRSRLAPHRVTKTWICPIRRWDRSEEMSMREVQDLTLNVARGLDRLDKRLQQRTEDFKREFGCLQDPDNAFGYCITAMPLGDDLRLRSLSRPHHALVGGLQEPTVAVLRQTANDTSPQKIAGLRQQGTHSIPNGWRPQLRAVRSPPQQQNDTMYGAYLELHCDGLVEFGWVAMPPKNELTLYSDEAIVEFATVLCWADTLRRFAGAVSVEYAVQVSIHVTGERLYCWPGSSHSNNYHWVKSSDGLSKGVTTFPRYSFTDIKNAPTLLSLFEGDLFNAGGRSYPDSQLGSLTIKYPIE